MPQDRDDSKIISLCVYRVRIQIGELGIEDYFLSIAAKREDLLKKELKTSKKLCEIVL